MTIHISFDDGQSLGTMVDITFTQTTSDIADADLHSIAQCMLLSDAIQNLNWSGTPQVSSITRDTVAVIFPT